MLRIISFTAQGCDLARRIAAKLPAKVYGKFHTEPQPQDGLQNVLPPCSAYQNCPSAFRSFAAMAFHCSCVMFIRFFLSFHADHVRVLWISPDRRCAT